MKLKIAYGAILAVVLCAVFYAGRVSRGFSGDPGKTPVTGGSVAQVVPPPTFQGMLNGEVVTEEYVDRGIVKGMRREDVEKVFGKPAQTQTVRGTERGGYRVFVSHYPAEGSVLVGFDVIYENGRVRDVDKSKVVSGKSGYSRSDQ